MSYFNATKLIDENGASYGVRQVDNKPRVSSMPYCYDIAEGQVSGHTPWTKIGYSSAITTTETDIWSKGGTYVFPTSGSRMSVVSTSGSDTSTGTGAQKVYLYYLNSNYISGSEEIILNGTTPVTTSASDIFRVDAFRVSAVGTSGCATGNISISAPSGSPTYSYISSGYTRARNSIYTVPAGKTLYIAAALFGYGYAANQTHYCRMYIRVNQADGMKTSVFYPETDIICANSSIYMNLPIPLRVVEKVDLKVSGVATSAGIVSSTLQGWLE